jgi:aspartyl protease family protein
MDGTDFARLSYLVLMLLALGGWVFVEYRGRMGFAMRSAMAWIMIFAGAAAGYALWQDIVARNYITVQDVEANGRITVPRASDGHYYLTLDISGKPLRFMVDTGASGVVLTKDDARSLGIDPDSLLYLGEATTANGTVRTAHTVLTDVALGPYRDDRIDASVNDGDLDLSLLGMDYLGRYRIEIEGNEMVLSR